MRHYIYLEDKISGYCQYNRTWGIVKFDYTSEESQSGIEIHK